MTELPSRLVPRLTRDESTITRLFSLLVYDATFKSTCISARGGVGGNRAAQRGLSRLLHFDRHHARFALCTTSIAFNFAAVSFPEFRLAIPFRYQRECG